MYPAVSVCDLVDPKTERWIHYFESVLPERFETLFDNHIAVAPIRTITSSVAPDVALRYLRRPNVIGQKRTLRAPVMGRGRVKTC